VEVPVTNRDLLMFVSECFQVTRYGGDTVLLCETHGEVDRWARIMTDGELTFMEAIGQHMDTVEHLVPVRDLDRSWKL
jgi:hypothetical protein